MIALPARLNPRDKFSQRFGRFNRFNLALSNDRAGDAPRLGLFAKSAKYFFQFRFGQSVNHPLGIQLLAPVHPHIEPCWSAKAKTPLRRIDLMG